MPGGARLVRVLGRQVGGLAGKVWCAVQLNIRPWLACSSPTCLPSTPVGVLPASASTPTRVLAEDPLSEAHQRHRLVVHLRPAVRVVPHTQEGVAHGHPTVGCNRHILAMDAAHGRGGNPQPSDLLPSTNPSLTRAAPGTGCPHARGAPRHPASPPPAAARARWRGGARRPR